MGYAVRRGGGAYITFERLFSVQQLLQLSLNDGSKTEVARYHRGSLGIIGPKKKPCLDINPDVAHMSDLIVLTFVYVEKLRMDKERAARNSGGGGP